MLALFTGMLLGCILCVAALLGINYSLPYVSAVVFPNSADAAMSMTRKLITAFRAGDTEKVNRLIDDPGRESEIMNDLVTLSHEDAIRKYKGLLICEHTMEGNVWESVGVIYYSDTSVRFTIEFIQDTNQTWKAHSIKLLPEDGPGADFGWCQ